MTIGHISCHSIIKRYIISILMNPLSRVISSVMMMMGNLCHCMHTLCVLRERGTGCRTAAMVAPLLLTSGLARCEAALHSCGTSSVYLLHTIATLCQLRHSGDMMYEIRRRKSKATLLQTQGIYKFPRHIEMVCEELAFGDALNYTQWGNGLQDS